jgi:hypothetical protein
VSVSAQLEAAHVREATITACQLRLREMGRGVAEGLVEGEPEAVRQIAVRFGQHLHDAADALDTLRDPTEISSETRARLKQAAELAYHIVTAAGAPTVGPGRFDSAGPSFEEFAQDLWNVLRLYELPGKEGATSG